MLRRTSILIADDPGTRGESRIGRLNGKRYSVVTVKTGEEALLRARNDRIDLAIVDYSVPGMGGIQLLRRLKETSPDLPVIVISAAPTPETAVEAMKAGACDYVARPLRLEALEKRITEMTQDEKAAAPRSLAEKYRSEGIVGKSAGMQRIFRVIEDISHSDATVLVQGESGTGKEIIARAIHRSSGRSRGPFITANCAAIPETLLESELFGYEKGAFTGALVSRKGRFELAEGGTLLLDEVTEMRPSAQVDLLRVLQEREFRRVGGSQLIDSDVRIIASSNKDVEEEVEHGSFREDLYYRLNVIPVHIPPLRVRKEDIPLLIDDFLEKHRREAKRKIRGISEETIELLMRYDWPGNVRELENVILRAMVLGKKEDLVSEDLPDKIRRRDEYHNEVCYPLGSSLEDVEKNYIQRVLNSTAWNVSRAARVLKLNRMTLYNKMRKYGFQRPSRK